MERKYDAETLAALRKEERTENIFGTTVIVRGIPFEKRRGEMDPRWREHKYGGAGAVNNLTKPAFPSEIMQLPAEQILLKIQSLMAGALDAKPRREEDAEFDVSCTWTTIASGGREVGAYRYERRSGAKEGRCCVLLLHGGGWFMGKPVYNDLTARYIAQNADALVFDVDYSLAPQNKFPAALEDVWSVLEYVSEHAETLGIARNKIAVMGGSAGANLAAALSLKDRDEGKGRLALQILQVPVVLLADIPVEGYSASEADFELSDEVEKLLGKQEPMEKSAALKLMVEGYVEHYPDDVRQPYLSPMLGDLKGVAPALMHVASLDSLWPQGIFYARRLREAGVYVRVIKYDGIEHETDGEVGVTPQAEDFLMEVCAALRAL